MKTLCILSKMTVTATSPVSYCFSTKEQSILLNDFLGQKIQLQFTHNIYCIACNKTIKKSYQDGYCFPCTQKLPQCDLCIVKPERCHLHLGTCRQPTWGESNCMIPHVVYLANASGVKVGITRKSQVPTRWIDQGAIAAMALFEVPTRRISGHVEVLLAKYVKDKTNWRKMLSGHDGSIDLIQERKVLLPSIQKDLEIILNTFGCEVQLLEGPISQFQYPILAYPKTINSLSFDKTSTIEGTLQGIKGQYLILDTGVINVRKHTGYEVNVKLG
ncbi:MAG: DUF2797 domain-containing protein [Proteobacteria bacterium]|nr:DUF2797 domain-containing protein [Pseudomonadota bacterium]